MMTVIGIDCDGVLADYKSKWILDYERIVGQPFPYDKHTSWELWDVVETEEHKTALKDATHSQGWCRSLTAYAGIEEGLARLREIAEIIPVTAPTPSPFWHHERSLWLQDFGFDKNDIMQVPSKRKKHVACDFLIDDKESTLHDWYAYQWRRHDENVSDLGAILWSQPYNEIHKPARYMHRTDDWKKVVDVVRRFNRYRVVQWEFTNPAA